MTEPKRKSCANCKNRVARYRSQLPHREWCNVFKLSTKGAYRSWTVCEGKHWEHKEADQ